MAQILKPVNLSLTWASGGDVLNPGDTKYATGWQVEIPPRQWFNYLDNRQDTALAHINQHGIAVWDSATEYQYSVGGAKSLVMGSNGTIYRALTVNTNQNPTTTVGTHWEIAFANTGDFYTKVQSDANYLAKTQNLADIPNAATARTNLSVYSQAQTYTKAEVDSKTTVASALQSQQQTSNTVLLTPQRLSDALAGANQSLSTNGFQKLPGGVIIQWGKTQDTFSSQAVTFPVPFTIPLFVSTHDETTAGSQSRSIFQVAGLTNTGFVAENLGVLSKGSPSLAEPALAGCPWFAIGF